MNDIMYMEICPKCGYITPSPPYERDSCGFCGHDWMIRTNVTYDEYINMVGWKKDKDWEQHLRETYVWDPTNTAYDPEEYSRRTEEDYQRELRIKNELNSYHYTPSPKSYACPQCGNDSFTPVRRKWSMWNGYRTNKIDMVCNRWGYGKKG